MDMFVADYRAQERSSALSLLIIAILAHTNAQIKN